MFNVSRSLFVHPTCKDREFKKNLSGIEARASTSTSEERERRESERHSEREEGVEETSEEEMGRNG